MRVLGIVSVVIGTGLACSATAQQPQPAKGKPAITWVSGCSMASTTFLFTSAISPLTGE